jgi:hypothetical protein
VKKKKSRQVLTYLNGVLALFLYVSLYLFTVEFFPMSLDGGIVRTKINFTPTQFRKALQIAVPIMLVVSSALGAFQLLSGLYYSSRRAMTTFLSYFVVASVCGLIFTASLAPFTTFEPTTHGRLPDFVKLVHRSVDRWNVVNSYGLFRTMTGVGGRPEIVIEAADSLVNPSWKEVEFLYKPGRLDKPLPFVGEFVQSCANVMVLKCIHSAFLFPRYGKLETTNSSFVSCDLDTRQ